MQAFIILGLFFEDLAVMLLEFGIVEIDQPVLNRIPARASAANQRLILRLKLAATREAQCFLTGRL